MAQRNFQLAVSAAALAASWTWPSVGAISFVAASREPQLVLSLAGVGDTGVTEGFSSFSTVTGYTATAGRYRLDLENDGFTICAADEERLCYAADGTFRGQYLQGADTYYSAPWHDAAATHTSGDFAYLAPRAGGSIAYAGGHAENDIFGGTGGGVVITQTNATGSFHIANNVKITVAEGDLMRHEAIVAVTPAGNAGTVGLRGAGNSAFAFNFDHDASGQITGFTESWNAHRAGYHDMGTINGKRWYYLWVDRAADSTGTEQQVAINYASVADETGRLIHVCELMIRKNPVCPPAAVPVCAAEKTFAADTLQTSLSNAGYACEGLAMARSQMPAGEITAPSVNIGVPYEPLETRIRLFQGAEDADRSGILHNENEALYNRPWRTPTDFEIFYGPSFFPADWEGSLLPNSACTNLTITPVFQARRDLRPILGRHGVSRAVVTGTLTLDGCVFLGVGDPVTSYWQQTDIHSFGDTTSFPLGGAAGVSIENALVLGGTLHTTRARHQVQADASEARQIYTGEFILQTGDGGSVSVAGTRFDHMARFSLEANDPADAVAADLSGTCFDYFWSDPIYWAQGTYDAPSVSNRFHGRITYYRDLSMWQSRKEIEVDTGGGYVDFSASGLSLEDLPHGELAEYVGSYDFGTTTFTPGTEETKTARIRFYVPSSGADTSRPGFEWQSEQMDMGHYREHPQTGDVFEVDDGTTKVRFTFDQGYYTSGPTWNAGTGPADLGTGTHADNEQVNRYDVTLTNVTASNLVFLNCGQGMFHTGDPNLTAIGSVIDGGDYTGVVAVLDAVSNAHRFDHSNQANSTEDLANAVFVQAASEYRYSNGKSQSMAIGAGGVNCTLQLGSNVWIATAHPDGISDSGGGVTTGTLNYIGLPVANYDGFNAATAGDAALTDILDAANIDANGMPLEVLDPWTYAFADTAAATLGFDPNAILTAVRGDHAAWNDVVADLVSAYLREPDHYAAIADSAAVGTVVASGLSDSAFHALYGGNGAGYFAIDGTDLKVASDLTGVDHIFVLRGENDETYVVDVS